MCLTHPIVQDPAEYQRRYCALRQETIDKGEGGKGTAPEAIALVVE
jgi:hypothetical protein